MLSPKFQKADLVGILGAILGLAVVSFLLFGIASATMAQPPSRCSVEIALPADGPETRTYLIRHPRRDGSWLVGEVILPQGQVETVFFSGTMVVRGCF